MNVGQGKNLNPRQDSTTKHRRALYPLELRRTHGERGHILGSYLTHQVHISLYRSLFGLTGTISFEKYFPVS